MGLPLAKPIPEPFADKPRFVFPYYDEMINLGLPFAFIILCLAELVTAWQASQIQLQYLRFMGNFLFFNSIHSIFTVFILNSLPELKTWREKKSAGLRYEYKALLVFACFFVANWLAFSRYELGLVMTLIVGLWMSYPLYHTFRQSYGILAMYNQRLDLNNSEDKTRSLGEIRLERRIFDWLFLLILAHVITSAMQHQKILSSEKLNICSLTLAGIFAFLWICLLGLALRQRHQLGVNKVAFVFRLLLYPLAFITPLGWIGVISIHGTEYMFVLKKMIKNSSAPARMWTLGNTLFFATIIGLALLSAKGGLLGIFTLGDSPGDLWYKISMVTFGSYTYWHYYTDGRIFAFKDPTTRELNGPLVS